MLTKRIIPCLDVKEGRVVKGTQFLSLRDAGDPVELARYYDEQGADELVFLDISASHEGRKTMLDVVEQVAASISIPFTVGGGINTNENIRNILQAGADKVSLNTAALIRPEFIEEAARFFGSQCIVVAIDAKYDSITDTWKVYTHGGRKETDWTAEAWAKEAVQLGAGELLVTSMDKDGEKSGFDVALLQKLTNCVNVPIIASGGAGEAIHFVDVFQEAAVDAALAASIFHYKETTIRAVKRVLKEKGVHVR
ncbi:imidazole glycerol phosphate synthase subunit HisF [Shouchella lehensis]|uniref:Imidazole glycerol phosphate synthase subunit HisF n=2 Tax=Shouchella lehensis TaxID=300825 RepID=A0A060LZK9_9BACI|nr:imidazole glycerol phosphate synthase subunit HisF [Shouchella lehensis]AIC95577.1 Imidazole glycerol phosphate synthase subunit hisF [Shouchella lehensis G1]MBG9783715.1 imidazole glycerol phosphate synthase [Shouchella lehensis]TES51331.1 imidazole glycerol phosphate synthase subunit HisF [Shouchella lehensis]